MVSTPNAREAELRLDTERGAPVSGQRASVEPGDLRASTLV